MRYKTKPCEVEAIQWTGLNGEEILQFTENHAALFPLYTMSDSSLEKNILYIYTLEGTMQANVGDYIIRGLRGEYYPCKQNVFKQKYEAIE